MKFLTSLSLALFLPLLATAKDEEKVVPDKSLSDVRWGEVVNEVDFNPDDAKGKVVVIEEWGVNCAPCIASLPEVAKLARRKASKGLVVVGFEVQKGTKDQIMPLLKKAKVKYPVMSGANAAVGTGGIPNVNIFNAEGKLVWVGNPHDREFEKAVNNAMKDAKS